MNAATPANPFASTTLLINPSRYPQYVKTLRRLVKRVSIPTVIESRSADHFEEEVRRFCGGKDRHLLVWGGDGTAHMAINAMMRARRDGEMLPGKSLGFLRGGTGNGIQDSYEVPRGIGKQIATYRESLSHGYTIDVDLILVQTGEQSWYAQLAGFGFDVDVLRAREKQKKRLPDGTEIAASGGFRYVMSGVGRFFDPRRPLRHRYEIELRHGKYAYRGTRVNAEFAFREIRRTVEPAMMEVGTRPYYGKMFKICPDVVCNDGNMDLYVFNFSRKFWIARNIVALWAGRHNRINRRLFGKSRGVIERYELTSMRVASPDPFGFHVDGELRLAERDALGAYSVTIDVAPRAISFIVPDHFYRMFHPFEEEEGVTDV